MSDQASTPTSDESILAAIGHFFGLLAAFIVWATQKDKSRYVRFQSIQAMAFDLIVSVIMLFIVGVIITVVLGTLAVSIGDIAIIGSQGNPTAEPARTLVVLLAGIPFLIPCILIPMTGIIFIARLVATILTFQGKNFHYPWLGAVVERAMRE